MRQSETIRQSDTIISQAESFANSFVRKNQRGAGQYESTNQLYKTALDT